jgi:4-hydroxy-tetrahydrodipicolinate reductase
MKIALIGYGKMGKEIKTVALERKHEIVLEVDDHNKDIISLDDLRKADVAIEFTNPGGVVGNILKCFEANIPVVVGTTGWHTRFDELKEICLEKNQTMFYASNFSIGVNIFFRLNDFLSKIMNNYPEYDVFVQEIHHKHKVDSPSGTAITLANQIVKNMDRKDKWVNKESDNIRDLEIKSDRVDEVPGTHVINYYSLVDDLELTHVANSRKGFAVGAVSAAEWVLGKKGVFGMDDLLKF